MFNLLNKIKKIELTKQQMLILNAIPFFLELKFKEKFFFKQVDLKRFKREDNEFEEKIRIQVEAKVSSENFSFSIAGSVYLNKIPTTIDEIIILAGDTLISFNREELNNPLWDFKEKEFVKNFLEFIEK